MSRVRTHYDNLKVARDAPVEIIHAAFRTLAAKYHPDVNPGSNKAAEIFRIISRSYEVLSDPAKRADHDRWIAEVEPPPVVPPPVFQVGEKRPVNKWIVGGCVGTAAIVAVVIALLAGREPDVPPKTQHPQASPAMAPTPIPTFEQFKASEGAMGASGWSFAVPNKTQVHSSPRSEIDDVIQSGKYSQMAPAEMVRQSTGSGPAHLSIVNQTIYNLTITLYGTSERSVKIPNGESSDLELAPGTYRVLGRASNPLVVPFVGSYDCAAGAGYESTFYVSHQMVP